MIKFNFRIAINNCDYDLNLLKVNYFYVSIKLVKVLVNSKYFYLLFYLFLINTIKYLNLCLLNIVSNNKNYGIPNLD